MTCHELFWAGVKQAVAPEPPSREEVSRACEELGITDWGSPGMPRVSDDDAKVLMKRVGDMGASLETWKKGLQVELEHGAAHNNSNITNNHPLLTAHIVQAHLRESTKYYDELAKMEKKLAQLEPTPPGSWLNDVGFGDIRKRTTGAGMIQRAKTPHPDFNTQHPGGHIDRPVMTPKE
jgi:hypothetical protein